MYQNDGLTVAAGHENTLFGIGIEPLEGVRRANLTDMNGSALEPPG